MALTHDAPNIVGTCVGVCGNVCCVAAVVEDSDFFEPGSVEVCFVFV